MTELGFDGGQAVRAERLEWVGRFRRWLLLFVIALLCGAAYLAGIWTGMNTHVTCAATGAGQIVCADGEQVPPAEPAPASPAQTPTA